MRKNASILGSVFLIMFSLNALAQSSGVTFEKSPKKYKIRSYNIYKDSYGTQPNINFKIKYKKEVGTNNGATLNSLSFGWSNRKNGEGENISFSGDTVFYYPPTWKKKKSPLFILSEKANNDTLYIPDFCSIITHCILFEKKYYYSVIKDTVYVFKLWYEENYYKEYPHRSTSASDDYHYFKQIAISKKYGFVWVNYYYSGKEVEIRYY